MASDKQGMIGWADRSEPGWEERVMEAVHTRRRARYRGKHRHTMDMSYAQRDLLRQAAEQRDMVVAAYVRRAVAAFIAYDLDLDLAEVCQDWVKPLPFGKIVGTSQADISRTHEPDDGRGNGSWRIESLR